MKERKAPQISILGNKAIESIYVTGGNWPIKMVLSDSPQ